MPRSITNFVLPIPWISRSTIICFTVFESGILPAIYDSKMVSLIVLQILEEDLAEKPYHFLYSFHTVPMPMFRNSLICLSCHKASIHLQCDALPVIERTCLSGHLRFWKIVQCFLGRLYLYNNTYVLSRVLQQVIFWLFFYFERFIFSTPAISWNYFTSFSVYTAYKFSCTTGLLFLLIPPVSSC